MKAEEMVNNLLDLYRENKLAHAYLIETNNIEQCFCDIKKVIKGISCEHGCTDVCNECNICNLIDNNSLPSLIVIEPDGKFIKKDAIDDLKNKFSSKPIYTKNNIYVVKQSEKMNETAFNRMLKFLEEPEDNIIGFFITENKDNIADTILSRCEIVKMTYLISQNVSTNDNNSIYELANQYMKLSIDRSPQIIWYNDSVLSKELETRNEVIIFLRILLDENLNKYRKTNIIEYRNVCNTISKYLEQLNYNVNISLLLNSLAIEIGEVYEI